MCVWKMDCKNIFPSSYNFRHMSMMMDDMNLLNIHTLNNHYM
jgi:hypothetical protein